MQNRKKILYVITKSNWGGAQRYVFDLATNLPQERFDTVVVTGGRGLLTEKLVQSKIRVIELPVLQKGSGLLFVLFSFRNLQALFKLITVFRKEKPDIIHLNSSKIGGLGAAAAFFHNLLQATSYKLQAKVIFTAHGWPFLEPRPHWQRGLIFFLTWLGSLLQDAIITINTRDFEVGQKFIPERKLHLIFNGIAAFNFLPRDQARQFFTEKIGRSISSDTILIGANAELTRNKGLDFLIEAINLLASQNNKFLSIIISDGEDKEKLEAKIRTLGLENSVFLIGFIPEAGQYLRGVDIFVLPSLKEGLPYALMEAMAAALAVVATAVGGIPDLIADGKDGYLVAPGNAEDLAGRLKELAEDETRRRKIGDLAAEKIRTKFPLHAMIEKTASRYE